MAADLILNPGSPQALRLMLSTGKGGARAWQEARVSRKPSTAEGAPIESTLEWTSWHGGDAHGRISATGAMPPVAAWGTLDSRRANVMTLPPRQYTVSGPTDVRYFTRLAASEIGIIGKNGADWAGWRWNAGTNTLGSALAIGAPGTVGDPTSIVVFDAVTYIGFGFSKAAWKFTSSVLSAGVSAVGWTLAARARDRLYIATTATQVRAVSTGADPTNSANWGALNQVADATANITSLAAQGKVLYIGREDGLYGLDEALTITSLIPELETIYNKDNSKNMTWWHGYLMYPHSRGFFAWADGLTMPAGLERSRSNSTPLNGRVFSMAQDGEWLWALVYSAVTGKTYLLAARERTADLPGEGPMCWIQLGEFSSSAPPGTVTTQPPNMIFGSISDETTPTRLFFWKNGEAAYIRATSPTDIQANMTVGDFAATGYKVLPVVDMGAPMVNKYLRSVEVDAECPAGTSVSISYALNTGRLAEPTFTALGSPITASGRTEIPFPAGVAGREVQLRVQVDTSDQTLTALVRRVALNYTDRPEKNTVIQATAHLADFTEDNDGVPMRNHPVADLEILQGMEPGSYQTLLDHFGREYNVLIVEVRVSEVANPDDEDNPQIQVQLTMERVT